MTKEQEGPFDVPCSGCPAQTPAGCVCKQAEGYADGSIHPTADDLSLIIGHGDELTAGWCARLILALAYRVSGSRELADEWANVAAAERARASELAIRLDEAREWRAEHSDWES